MDERGSHQPTTGMVPQSALTHLDEHGRARMVDVGEKAVSRRTARAACRVVVSADTAARLRAGDLPKGDALTVARVAGIQAAKRTAELIPFCHQLALDHVEVAIAVDPAGVVEIRSEASAADRTGVELEAMTAAAVAALTVYDMVKAVERRAWISDLRLTEKTGGGRGDWSSGELHERPGP